MLGERNILFIYIYQSVILYSFQTLLFIKCSSSKNVSLLKIYSRAIQELDEFASSSEQIWRN